MKLSVDQRLPLDAAKLAQRLTDLLTQSSRQVNALTEGRISALPALTTPPTTGLWAQGDLVRNSAPVDTAGDTVFGWLCVASGEPGTWFALTINSSGGGGGGGGTVTSVAATVPSFLSVGGSPITGSGTLAFTYSGTALPIANGGTSATTAAAARTALGLGTVATLAYDTDTTLAADSDARVATQKAVKAYVDEEVFGVSSIKARIPGTLTAFVGSVRWYPKADLHLTLVTASQGTAPAVQAVYNVRKNGVVLFSSGKPTVAAGQYTATPVVTTAAVTTADYLTIDVETADGADATVQVDFTYD